ncbi:uncharacterized protein LOC129794776 [Lutzomyia longipalpis]|uniref:uncharacterized protein LOC129794776 n=1 Tax=Lutzomyia longipalpis TaxID=7200 RepID=UPI00248438FD|nr:uncharacterized protein LOC129794776 [Lutzomyia longipalpis]
MFRLKGISQTDPIEERRRVREAVKKNVVTFLALCAAIRIAPIVLRELSNAIQR